MEKSNVWTEADFDELRWHDVHIHAIRIVEEEYGAGSLIFDLDYILEWGACEPAIRFIVAPASLEFRDANDLKMLLDYAAPRAALAPFSIHEIAREVVQYRNVYTSYRWTIPINWPSGEITFESPGFTLRLTGPSIETDLQYLTPAQRSSELELG